MPGITGIIGKKSNINIEKEFGLMLDVMKHEAFFDIGTYFNPKLSLCCGWAFPKDSLTDCLPIANKQNTKILIFFGENFSDTKNNNLIKKYNSRYDQSSGELILYSYEKKGEKFLIELNGWFCGVLADLDKKIIILFNDRYGMQRLYYYENSEAFYFSSEAKSLLKVLPETRVIDPKGLGEYFCFRTVLEGRTLFQKIYTLPGGSCWTFYKGKKTKKEIYFEPKTWENQSILCKTDFYNKLSKTFKTILPRYFLSNKKIGMSLTGGLDTRMILACNEFKPKKIPCYTFGGIFRDSADVKISRKLANLCGQNYTVFCLDSDFLSKFHSFAEKSIYISDGLSGIGGSYELYLNKCARKIAPVRMTGDFGSEILRGVSTLKAHPPSEMLFHPDFRKYIKEAKNTFSKIKSDHQITFTVFKELPWTMYGYLAIQQSQLLLRTPYMDNNLVKLVYQAPAGVCFQDEISLKIIKENSPEMGQIKTDQGVGGNLNFLFSKYAQFISWFTFKAEYYYNYGMPHWMARIDHKLKALHIEKILLGRHKFHHFRIWFRDQLNDYIKEILLEKRSTSRSYLYKNSLETILNGHSNGNRNYTTEIDMILSAELIQRLLIENR